MTLSPKNLVEAFLMEVRSGKNPEAASKYLAHNVRAHQVVSEEELVISRTPSEYADHVEEMKLEYGNFVFTIDELFGEGDKVYARWSQQGNGITSVTSCVYRVTDGLISEYWIQIDRLGIDIQKAKLGNLEQA